MAIEFSERLRRIPVYPAADAYAVPEDVAMMASNARASPSLSASPGTPAPCAETVVAPDVARMRHPVFPRSTATMLTAAPLECARGGAAAPPP